MKKVLFIFGTRPEAIKLAPVIKAFKKDRAFKTIVCTTAQHRKMLDQVLEFFEIEPDYDLKIMQKNQKLEELTARVLKKAGEVLTKEKPDYTIVQGDTTSAFASALSSFYHKIPVCHIEAGLRTNDIYAPYPEEINRRIISTVTALHFAPTQTAKNNLLEENVQAKNILITGNTVIDALFQTINKINSKRIHFAKEFGIDLNKKYILVTGHRRESFGQGFKNICTALKKIAQNNKNIDIIYPVHLNPNVQDPVYELLGNIPNIKLIKPLDYVKFVYLMYNSYLIITDSGGVQEEAPSIGKPVLVMREITERPEVVKTGNVKLVGTNIKKIVNEAQKLLENVNYYRKMAKKTTVYGNGNASLKILNKLKKELK
jgi:UDP-N-acetylglucosamine 2-epimerase (non-hydrolysing)